MPSVKNILWTIGGAESTPGIAVARTHVLPVRSNPSLTKKPVRAIDPAIVGSNMDVGEYPMQDSVEGSFPLSPRSCPGFGKVLKGLLGAESTPVQIAAVVRVRYAGSSASCKLAADGTGNTLNSKIGALGTESNDAAFGTAGTIDLAGASYDTLTELVAYIAGLTDYEAELVAGLGSVSSGEIQTVTYTQGKDRWAYFFFAGAATGVYWRRFTPVLTDTERSTYSIQGEGYQDTGLLYDGNVFDQMKISAALSGMVEADVDVLGMKETIGQTPTGFTLEDRDPYIFWKGSTTIKSKEFTYTANLSMTMGNSHRKETYGQGLMGRQYQSKAMFSLTGDLQVRLDADSYAKRAEIFGSTPGAMSFHFKGKDIAASVPEMLIASIPFALMSNFEFVDRDGSFDAKMTWKGVNPKGTKWDGPLYIDFISQDAAAF
jgi:hypothetical protein